MDNPLFPTGNQPDDKGYVLPAKGQDIAPLPAETPAGAENAADLIRAKLARLYASEPDARQELAEAAVTKPLSRHQQFMQQLSQSGKDLAEIQTAWHNYYVALPDDEKRQVWQEFYDSNSRTPAAPAVAAVTPLPPGQPEPTERLAAHKNEVISTRQRRAAAHKPSENRSPEAIRAAIRHKVSAGGKLRAKHHLQSLLFGLGLGAVTIVIFLFGFFNEVIIAPFIQPSRQVTASPIILSSSTVAPTATPEVIIPKINVEIPVDYSQTSTNEATIENALNSGVVHYPSTVLPGQTGNAAFFGHSSNNIFNPGKYKFAFVLLHELVPGDTFYLTYGGKLYAYKVFSKTIVSPSDVGVLNPVSGHSATATLITCDPPGTSLNRLVVVGDQISPSPSGNSAAPAPAPTATSAATVLPGNGPTLWGRWWGTAYGKLVTIVLILGAAAYGWRRLRQPAQD